MHLLTPLRNGVIHTLEKFGRQGPGTSDEPRAQHELIDAAAIQDRSAHGTEHEAAVHIPSGSRTRLGRLYR